MELALSKIICNPYVTPAMEALSSSYSSSRSICGKTLLFSSLEAWSLFQLYLKSTLFPLLPAQDCYNSFWLLLLLFPIHILLSCQSDLLKCLRSYHSHLKTLTDILPGWQGPLWSSHSLPHLLLASPVPRVPDILASFWFSEYTNPFPTLSSLFMCSFLV